MTRKENLLIEIYNLRNQISEIKGNTIVNIEEFCQTRKFRDEAASWKEFELKLRIEELKKNLEKAKSRLWILQHSTLPLNGTAYAARLFGATTT